MEVTKMPRKKISWMVIILIAGILLTACGAAATPTQVGLETQTLAALPTQAASTLVASFATGTSQAVTPSTTVEAVTETPIPPIESLSTICPNGVKVTVNGIKVDSGSVICITSVVSFGIGNVGFSFDVGLDGTITKRDDNPGICEKVGTKGHFYTCDYQDMFFSVMSYKEGQPYEITSMDQIPVELTFDMEALPITESGKLSLTGVKESSFSSESISWEWKMSSQTMIYTWYDEQQTPLFFLKMKIGTCIDGWIISAENGWPVASHC